MLIALANRISFSPPLPPDKGEQKIKLLVERILRAELVNHAAHLLLVALEVLRGEVDALADNAHVVFLKASCGDCRSAYADAGSERRLLRVVRRGAAVRR